MYLGLVDSGNSGSMVNKEIVEYMTLTYYYKRRQQNEMHPLESSKQMMVPKLSKDKHDFILGQDLLTNLGLNINYNASQFVLENIRNLYLYQGTLGKN